MEIEGEAGPREVNSVNLKTHNGKIEDSHVDACYHASNKMHFVRFAKQKG